MVNQRYEHEPHEASTENRDRTPDEDPSLSSLLRDLRDEASTWVRQETRLVKAELASKINQATKNIGLLIVGGLIAYTGAVILLLALSAGMAILFEMAGLNIYAAYFAAFGLVGMIASGVGILIAKRAKESFSPEELAPERTMQTLQETKEWAGEKLR